MKMNTVIPENARITTEPTTAERFGVGSYNGPDVMKIGFTFRWPVVVVNGSDGRRIEVLVPLVPGGPQMFTEEFVDKFGIQGRELDKAKMAVIKAIALVEGD